MEVPSYTKVLTLGVQGTERALVGNVIVQEKVDGSQFAFGISHGEIGCRSHHQQIDMDNPGMFGLAVEHVRSISETLRYDIGDEEAWFYCEYLQKPKHNTLAYERTPKNHLVLFDATHNGTWFTRLALEAWGREAAIDVIPELSCGEVTISSLANLLKMPSYRLVY